MAAVAPGWPQPTGERAFRRLGTGLPRRTRREWTQAKGGYARELMTSPTITIHPGVPR